MRYRILVKPWAVYVKEEPFFESQGGLTKEWGKDWESVEADSIEHARSIGRNLQEERGIKPNRLVLGSYPSSYMDY